MKYLLFIMAATIPFSSIAARHRIFRHYTNIIHKADTVMVYSIDTIPTEPTLQLTTQKYAGNYRITAANQPDSAKIASLKKAVLQKENYLTDVMKRCPFMGSYAIAFVKGKKKITLIVSSAACPKAMVYLPNQKEPYLYDMAEHNTIEALLR